MSGWAALLLVTAGACPSQRVTSGSAAAPSTASAALPSPHDSAATAARLAAYIDTLPGAGISGSLLVARAGRVLFRRGFGSADMSHGLANGPETLFDIGSIAKTITAVAVLRLEQDGRLHDTDSLGRYFAGLPPEKAAITIRQLLTHTAGVGNYVSDGDFDAITPDSVVRAALGPPLRWPPGTKEAYSNAGYALLALIVERAAGEPFQDYVRRKVLTPARMHTATWIGDSAVDGRVIARGYIQREEKGDPRQWSLTWSLIGQGGMLASVDDLYRFLQALRGPALLTQQSKQNMDTPGLKRWTSGWEVQETKVGQMTFKGGANDFGFSGAVARFPTRDLEIVILLNGYRRVEKAFHRKAPAAIAELVLTN